ncbi:MAG: anthranilate synthase component II [Aureliella sp.]
MILLIDNYDSFTFNLRRYLCQLGGRVKVLRNDAPELDEDLSCEYSAIVVSPGPKAPVDAGSCLRLILQWSGKLPILGVCLGHQAIFEAFGGNVVRSNQPIHGRSTPVRIDDSPLFEGIEDGARFARYHSLVCDPNTIPTELRVIATSDEKQVMAIQHHQHATFGVQFHPESILSLDGMRLLRNFLRIAGIATPAWSHDHECGIANQADVQPRHVEALDGLASGHAVDSEAIAVLPQDRLMRH